MWQAGMAGFTWPPLKYGRQSPGSGSIHAVGRRQGMRMQTTLSLQILSAPIIISRSKQYF